MPKITRHGDGGVDGSEFLRVVSGMTVGERHLFLIRYAAAFRRWVLRNGEAVAQEKNGVNMRQLARDTGVSFGTIRYRIKVKGMTPEEAVRTRTMNS